MEETNPTLQGTATETKPADAAILLTQFIERNAIDLMGILRSYVRKGELASNNEDVQETSLELLNEVYIEAVKTAHRFDPARSPRAWLLGIATNMIKRKKTEQAKRLQHEISLSLLQQESGEQLPAENSLDLISAGPEQWIEANEQLERMLSLVSESDRDILRLSVIQELDGEALAQHLGCLYTTAQVRLYRAKKRLRTAVEKQRGESNE
jgi:RNA polymerase sigma factor (sigma-70 family)